MTESANESADSTEIELAIKRAEIPAFARSYCDIWGNIKKTPIKAVEQAYGPNFIRFSVYQADTGYFYGYQLKIKKLILQKEANITDTPHETQDKACRADRNELLSIVSNYSKKMLGVFFNFDKICYEQPELF